jgi:hypothetical protein
MREYAIKIRRIADVDVPAHVTTPIQIDPTKQVKVLGTVEHPCGTVTCTLITPGLVRTQVAIPSGEKEWQVNFGVPQQGLYDLTACALEHQPARLEVQVGNPPRDKLSITSCKGNPTVHVTGKTNHPNTSVTCTLILNNGSDVQVVQSNSQGAWQVDFGAKPLCKCFFSATAPGEGKVACDITVT